jgi:hypothetical protein
VADLKRGYSSIYLKGYITSIVHVVLGPYVHHNGLAVVDDSRRRILAYAVFHELDSSSRSETARFPKLDKLTKEEDSIKRQALGVLDVHVESRGDTVSYVGGRKVSVSITPAMSMLLDSLLGVEATVYNSWEGLEAIAGSHAAYLEVLTNVATRTKGVRLVRLTRPVPAPRATRSFCIPPPTDTPTVTINGDRAPFFDAISRNRGFQSKYTKEGESVDIYIAEEMQKGGLVKEMLSLGQNDTSKKFFEMGMAVMTAFVHS